MTKSTDNEGAADKRMKDFTDRLKRQVQLRVQGHQYAEAQHTSEKWLARAPEDPEAHYWQSVIALPLKQYERATTAAQQAVALEGNNAHYLCQLTKCHLAQGDNQRARTAIAAAEALQPNSANTLDTIGVVYSHLGEHEKAAALFERAVTINPRNANYFYNLGAALNFCHRVDAAERAYRKALELAPSNYNVYWTLSHLRTQRVDANHIDILKALLANSKLPAKGQIYLNMALAKELEDVRDYSASFSHLKQGCDTVAQLYPYDPEPDRRVIESLIGTFTEPLMGSDSVGCESEEPIFIVGLPRTGTTLVERLLASHDHVFAAGELNDFYAQWRELASVDRAPLSRVELYSNAGKLDYRQLGENYIASTRPRTGHTRYFIDKMPMNFLHLGAIALALPKAKIIHVTRNPMDTCLSNYKQLFRLGTARHTYELESMGKYYLHYRRLMAHWHRLLPGRFLDISYEALVQQPEQESQRLYNHCDLPWDKSCLDFYRQKQAVGTASAAQVRKPIYSTAVNRWRYFHKELKPLRKLFQQYGLVNIE